MDTKELMIKFSADMGDIKRKLGDLSKQTSKTADQAISSSNAIKNAFKTLGAAISVKAIADFGTACFESAANIRAVESQFTQTFGKIEKEAAKNLGEISKETGVMEGRIKGSYTKIAAFAKTTGMETDKANDVAKRSMIAVADSAAYYDRSIEDTTESLQSFLKGNFENDAALGLSCTETTRNAKANDLYGKSFKELSEEQKQLTLLAMVEEANELSGAMGQAARESNTWTNQTGNLKQAFAEFQGQVGELGLDFATNAVAGLADGLGRLTDKLPSMVEWIKNNKAELGAFALALGSVGIALTLFQSGVTISNLKMKLLNVTTKISTALTAAWGQVMAFVTSPITLIIVGIGLLIAALVVCYKKCGWFRDLVDGAFEKIKETFNSLKETVISVKDKLVGAWDELVEKCTPVVNIIKGNLLGAFREFKDLIDIVGEAFGNFAQKFTPVKDFLSEAFNKKLGETSKKFSELKDDIIDLVKKGLEKLNSCITDVREWFVPFKETIAEMLEKLEPLAAIISHNLLKSLKGMKKPISSIKESFKTLWDTLKELVKYLWDILKPILEGLKPLLKALGAIFGGALVVQIGFLIGVVSGFIKAIKGIAKVISGVIKTVVNVFKFIIGLFTGNADMISESWEGIKDGIVEAIKGVWQAIKGFLTGFWDGIKGFFEGLFNTDLGKKIKDKIIEIWNSIKEAWDEQWNKMKEKWNTLKTFFVDLWNSVKNKTSELWQSIKDNTVGKVIELKDKAVKKFNEIKDSIIDKVTTLKTKVSEKFNSIKTLVGKTVGGLTDKVKSKAKGFANAFISMVNKAVSGFLKGINKIISGVNWVYEKITGTKDKFSKIQVKKHKIPLLAKGTGNWRGGLAIFGEKGREIVSDPNMGTFVANSASLGYLSKGATVIPNKETERILGSCGIPAFGKGQNYRKKGKAGMVASDVEHQTGEGAEALNLLKQAWKKYVNFGEIPSWTKGLVSGLKKIFTGGSVLDWVKKLIKDNEDKTIASWTGDNGGKWAVAKGWAEKALEVMGYTRDSANWNAFMTAYRIVGARESNYNNAAWNKWDINAKRGTPSRGWLQFIEPTFNSYKKKGYNNWLDPIHQAIAFINYANKRYGGPYGVPGVKSVRSGGRYLPYANGGLITNPTMALMGEAGTEAVVPLSNSRALKPFGQAVVNSLLTGNQEQPQPENHTYEFIIPVMIDGKEVAKATATFTKEELDRMEKHQNRLKGKK